MTLDERRVAVIGGGISGVTAAYTLKSRAPEVSVTLFEKSPELGGKLRTVELGGSRLEAGADSFLVRDRSALDLARDIGLESELVEPAIFGGLVWDGKTAEPMPQGTVMGLPVSVGAIRRAGNISAAGKLRALADLTLPGRLEKEDVAVGPFLRSRFGAEWTSAMVDPILAGTRSGDIERMSLRYALPQVFDGARRRSSVMRSLAQGPAGAAPRFKTPIAGMTSFVAKVSRAAPIDIRKATKVHSVTGGDHGWVVSVDGAPDENFDAVVVALPFHQTAPLFAQAAPGLGQVAHTLRSMPHASVAAVALAYRPSDITWPSSSSGFLVPSSCQRTLAAGTWWSAKWPHTRGADPVIVRCFVGRSGRHPALSLDDSELALRAAAEIRELTGSGTPIESRVDRWDDGLPQFEVGHHDRLQTIEEGLRDFPGLTLAGPDLTGSGIPECISKAQDAALRTLGYLEGTAGEAVGRR